MGGWQSTMHTSMYSRGGEMAALCGCQSAHLAPLSPINRAYNREAASLSAARELQPWKSGEWFLGGGEGGSVTWMIASLCFPARYNPPLPTKSSLHLVHASIKRDFQRETHRENVTIIRVSKSGLCAKWIFEEDIEGV